MAAKAYIVRLPEHAYQRLGTLSAASVRPVASLATFAVSHSLHLADTDPDAFRAASIDAVRSAPGDVRTNLSGSEPTFASLLAALLTTYDEVYKTPVRPHQALRAAILTWLQKGTDSELLAEVGAPPVPERMCAMT